MRNDILSLLEKSGLEISYFGTKNIMALCPYHHDTSPSLSISPNNGVWYCFSCCKGGTLKHLLNSKTRVRKKKVVQEKRYSSGIGISVEQYNVLPSAEGCKFLLNRGITDNTIREWEIKRSLLSVVIPIKKQDNIIGLISRVLLTDYNPKYKLSFGFEKRKYLFPEIASKNDFIILVEGPIDCIKLQQLGYKNVHSSLGLNVTSEHIDVMKKTSGGVMLLFDNDSAGLTATKKVARTLMSVGLEVFVPDYTIYKSDDPGDMDSVEIDNLVNNKISYLRSRVANFRSSWD